MATHAFAMHPGPVSSSCSGVRVEYHNTWHSINTWHRGADMDHYTVKSICCSALPLQVDAGKQL